MFAIPSAILRLWFLALASLALLGGGVWLGHEWYRRSWGWDEVHRQSVFAPHLGWNLPTLLLALALLMGLWTVAGGALVRGVLGLLGKTAGGPPARETLPPATVHRLPRPDGSELHVEVSGPADAPALVLTHGWGADHTEWDYLRAALGDRFRFVTWDLPGLGLSTRPGNRDYDLDNLARDLDAVLGLAAARPAVLVGHSIGGMVTLTFCRLFTEKLGPRVAGLVLVHTTFTDPVRTTRGATILSAIERPVLVPLMWVTIALSPLVWLLNWLSYLNGTAHLSTKRSGFAGTETWREVEFITRYLPRASPAVLARGMLGMMRYDATATLPNIPVPVLVIPGDRDTTCLPTASGRMERDIPGARLVPLVPAKHMGLIEHHGRFAELVADFARPASVA